MAESVYGPISPELVLVSPDLRAALMREFEGAERLNGGARDLPVQAPPGPPSAAHQPPSSPSTDRHLPVQAPPASPPAAHGPPSPPSTDRPLPVKAPEPGAPLIVGTMAYLLQRLLVLGGQAAMVAAAVVVAIVALELLAHL